MVWLFVIFGVVMNFSASFADVRAIIFDCDGVLVDSEYGHYLSWQYALQKQGGDLSHEEYLSYIGHSGPITAQLLAQKINYGNSEQLLKDKRTYYSQHIREKMPPIEAAVNLLRALGKNKESLGLKIGVCSASTKEGIFSHLERFEVVDFLDVVLSGQEDLKEYDDPEGVNKPKPYIYLKAAKLLGVLPEQCVVIEDSAPGVRAGVSAGCLTIAFPNEYTKLHDLSKAQLRLTSMDLQDLNAFLELVQNAMKKNIPSPISGNSSLAHRT
jgi:HAD superfamily hydrolase (TIGR01509 family)